MLQLVFSQTGNIHDSIALNAVLQHGTGYFQSRLSLPFFTRLLCCRRVSPSFWTLLRVVQFLAEIFRESGTVCVSVRVSAHRPPGPGISSLITSPGMIPVLAKKKFPFKFIRLILKTFLTP